jgi:hypothetical protein
MPLGAEDSGGNLQLSLAALLTLSFALSMTVVLGPHEPLNYSVFVFAFASLYLGLSQDVE